MATGFSYNFEYIRVNERAKALESAKKAHALIEEKMKLVKEGKMRLVKVPITNGYKLHFENI